MRAFFILYGAVLVGMSVVCTLAVTYPHIPNSWSAESQWFVVGILASGFSVGFALITAGIQGGK